MTFILNILNAEFSLLAADTKATSVGPATITIGKFSIESRSGITLEGVRKVRVNSNGSLAFASAGNTQEHSYGEAIERGVSANEAMLAIRRHMEEFLVVNDRAAALQAIPAMEQSAILTAYDRDNATYFTNLCVFGPLHNATKLYFPPQDTAFLINSGSGGAVFEKSVGLDEIRRFATAVRSLEAIPQCVEWLRTAFEKVSANDPGSGAGFSAVVSTRNNPKFEALTT